jgi:cyclopropane fatty-acyl-phospholipid synthase-like methyltransferase
VGCGTGRELKILADHGFMAYGIDFSPKTVFIARKNVPSAKIIVGNFLTKSFNTKFHGIVMISSFHLFPKNDVPLVLNKLNSLLVPSGYCLISIIKSTPKYATKSDEGYFPQKANPQIIRFKTRYTEKDFKHIFNTLGWASMSKFYRRTEREYLKQKWMNIIIKKR